MLDDIAFSMGRTPAPPLLRAPHSSRPGKRRPQPPRPVGCFPPNAGATLPLAVDDAAARQSAYDCLTLGIGRAEGAGAEETARLRQLVEELKTKCEGQARELEDLRKMGPEPTSPPAVASRLKSTDTPREDSSLSQRFDAQSKELDALHREVGNKGRLLRKQEETIQTLRAELQQEKNLVERYREQLELLEEQLSGAKQKQHRAEDERAIAEWHLRSAHGGRTSRSCTPRPGTSKGVAQAWAEPPARSASVVGQAQSCTPRISNHRLWAEARPESRGRAGRSMPQDQLEDSASSGVSDDDEEPVFHPPPVGPCRYR